MKIIRFLFIIFLAGCTLFKARPAKNSGFLPMSDQLVEMRERAPFNRIWLSPDFDLIKQKSNTIYFSPVNLYYLEEELKKDFSGDDLRDKLEEAQELSKFMVAVFKMTIENNPIKPFKVVEEPKEDTIKLEIALVDLVPTKPAVNTLGTVLGFVIPGTGLISLFGSGSIAIEGVVRECKNNQIIFEFADRESDKSAPFTIRDFQKFAHTRNAISEWANQFTELSVTDRTHMVDDSLPFTLNPL